MTDILCPVCGEPNPPEATSCKACQAPLKTSAFTPDFAEGADLPDWLRKLSSQDDTLPASAPTGDDAAMPDWLSEISQQADFEPPAEAAAELPAEAPDWLASTLAEEPSPPQEAEEQDWAAGWLAEVQAESQPAGEVPEEQAPLFTFDQLEEAELADLQAEGTAGEEGVLSTLPDWVSEVAAEQPEDEALDDQAGLAPAELPSWLEAMRPSEAEVPSTPAEDVSGAAVESSGPLIGLRGVLSGEPLAIRSQRPAAYSLKLRVTDDQKQRVTLMEQLLAEEPKPKVLPVPPVITARYIFRLLIALILVLPVAWAVVTDGRIMPLPAQANLPGSVLAVYGLIESLPDQTPVLVAFDYEAGYSGEMEAAGFTALEHLAGRRAYLTLVSTNATGPALAERFMALLGQRTTQGALPAANYANLGYVPGGSIGLFSLVRDLRQTLPYDLRGFDIWQAGPLSNINSLADFGMVLVLVNDPEVARAWIEQTGSALRQTGTPLVMITSAQAAPLVQPYFAGYPQQVQGLVAGMPGGAAYESAVAANGPARQSWDAYSIGLMASVFVIVAGAVLVMAIEALGLGKKGN